MIKIGVSNLKGGVGKSTLSTNLAVCLVHQGYKVCIVDTDENRSSSRWYAERDDNLPKMLVVGTVDPKGLNKAVDNLNKENDFVIIDGTPSLGKMSSMIMAASDMLLIPIRPGAHDVRVMEDFIERLEKAKEINEELKTYFVLNEYNEKTTFNRAIKAGLEENYPNVPILTTVLKSRIAYAETSVSGMGVYEYSDLKAKSEIEALTNEILELSKTEVNNDNK